MHCTIKSYTHSHLEGCSHSIVGSWPSCLLVRYKQPPCRATPLEELQQICAFKFQVKMSSASCCLDKLVSCIGHRHVIHSQECQAPHRAHALIVKLYHINW